MFSEPFFWLVMVVFGSHHETLGVVILEQDQMYGKCMNEREELAQKSPTVTLNQKEGHAVYSCIWQGEGV